MSARADLGARPSEPVRARFAGPASFIAHWLAQGARRQIALRPWLSSAIALAVLLGLGAARPGVAATLAAEARDANSATVPTNDPAPVGVRTSGAAFVEPSMPGGSRPPDGTQERSGSRPALGTVRLPEPGQQILFADLDGDGRDDPVVVHGGNGGCRLGRVVRSGPSADAAFAPLEATKGAALLAPALGDTDGDGTADLVSADSDGLLVRKGLGLGAFAPSPRRLLEAFDLVLPGRGCAPVASYVLDIDSDGAMELVLPILGGIRIVPLSGSHAAALSASETASADALQILTEPRISGRPDGMMFISAVPAFIDGGASRIGVLGPVLDSASPRLDLTWWSLDPGAPPEPHRTSLALPPGESALFAHPFDLEGDGRPEIAVLTAPRRLTKLLGEFGLRVYRASDRADTPVAPFFSAATNINYWQLPVLTSRRSGGGSDLLIAFYRGLSTAHLNVEVFRGDAAGSFERKPRDVEIPCDKEAARQTLIWADVDADGLTDLVTADRGGLRIHRGSASRDKPVAAETSWRTQTPLDGGGVSISIGEGGGVSIRVPPSGSRFFRDLDGDGLAEAIFLKGGASGTPEVVIEKLRPAAFKP